LGAIGAAHPSKAYRFPVPGGYITSLFGPRTHPVTGISSGKNHGALDIGAQPGAVGKPIVAPTDGQVVMRSDNVTTRAGRTLGLQHKDGWSSTYSHLLTSPLKVGDRVKRGQVIAYMGNTGSSSTGPHLHWVVRSPDGQKQDPLQVLWGPQPLGSGLAASFKASTIPGAHSGGGIPWLPLGAAFLGAWYLTRRKK
jgi:murein DD-endopeptidase MepM/ murein hydrolase activator NlpD